MNDADQPGRLGVSMLAGLQAGVMGGAAMLFVLSIAAMVHGRSFWSASNLIATTFYGDEALRRGFRFSTLSGAALQLILAGVLGIVFAIATNRLQQRFRVRLLGIAFALAWFILCDRALWRVVSPLIDIYAPTLDMTLAHAMLGYYLGAYPRYADRIETHPLDLPS
jgi:hypothetical protein